MKAGQVIATRFEIERRAGAGGMGTVYRAKDRMTAKPVAVKVIHGDASEDLGRFSREAAVLEGLVHPGIVGFIAHGATEEGELFLVMEWLDGFDLSHLLQRGPLSVGDTLALATRLAEALSFAHQRGIIHRDIKPANIFLEHGLVGQAKLLDFGLARALDTGDKITKTGDMLGTPGYMAPEQARGSKTVDARADIFALGSVLYRCLTGMPAFAGDSSMSILMSSVTDPTPRASEKRPDLPPDVDSLVYRMLSKDPSGRPWDGRVLLAELGAIVANNPEIRSMPQALQAPAYPMPPGADSIAQTRMRPPTNTAITPNAYTFPTGPQQQPYGYAPPPAPAPRSKNMLPLVVGAVGMLAFLGAVVLVVAVVLPSSQRPVNIAEGKTDTMPAVGGMAPPAEDEMLEDHEICPIGSECKLIQVPVRESVDLMLTVFPEAKKLAARMGDKPELRAVFSMSVRGPRLNLHERKYDDFFYFSVTPRSGNQSPRLIHVALSGRQLTARDATEPRLLNDFPVIPEPTCTIPALWKSMFAAGAPAGDPYDVRYQRYRADASASWKVTDKKDTTAFDRAFDANTCKLLPQ